MHRQNGWNKVHHKVESKRCQDSREASSKTAGVEALLSCGGARVMLRCNINVKGGLVNGAIGTVVEIHV